MAAMASSARRFRYNAPMDERLPATSMMDTAGMAGYAFFALTT